MIGTNKPSNEAENLATQATDATPSYAQVRRQKSKAPIFAPATAIRFSELSTTETETASVVIKGDPSGWSQPPVDIEAKVALYYKEHILKRNFCFDVNRRLGPT